MIREIIGLDLSLTGTGVATSEGTTTIKPKYKGVERLIEIRTALELLIPFKSIVIIEGYSFGSKGRAVFNIGELGGVIRTWLCERSSPFAEVPPSNLKLYALGKGGGPGTDKHAMRMEAFKRGGIEFEDDNQCDAWWLRQMGQYQYAFETETIIPMPEKNKEAFKKVEWPDG